MLLMPIVVVVITVARPVKVSAANAWCKCNAKQRWCCCCCCKSSGIDYALLYPEKKKESIVRSARIHDNKIRNTNNNKKKNILLSKVARHHCKSAATCHMPCLTQLLPLQLALWQFYWMQHKVFRSKRESEHSLSFAALIIIYLKSSFVALA